MDSYVYKGRQWVACHECKLSGGSLALCDIGKNITDAKSNYFKYGCWAGELMEKFKNDKK